MRFLRQVAKHIKNKEYNLHDLVVILPTRRAIRYLKNELIKEYKQPVFSPLIITIDDWVKLQKPNIVDKTRSLITLYRVHLEIESEPESFEDFMQWGTTLLSDFDDIDRYLLDSKQIFLNLKSIKELEAWQIEKPPSKNQEKFEEFWGKLDNYYHRFQTKLQDQGFISSAKAYRELAETTANVKKDKYYLFVGFNALSKSETTIIKKLVSLNLAEFLIDADRYYYDDELHEAGMFLRKAVNDIGLKEPHFVNSTIGQQKLHIQVYETPQKSGQAKIASSILSVLTQEELNETALILADEKLIPSVLDNLPSNIEKANITLGFPIEQTVIKHWVDLLFSIQENKIRFKTNAIYHSDLLHFFQHQFSKFLLSDGEYKKIQEIEFNTTSRNKVFQSVDALQLPKKTKEFLKTMTVKWENRWDKAVSLIREMNQRLIQELPVENEFYLSCLIAFDNSILEFQKIVEEGLPDLKIKSFKNLFFKHWSSATLAFQGTPTHGLQIMGILESRLLDFKNVLVLGFNEGSLPSNNPMDTILPIDLRYALGLPTSRNKQGVFAHHFYRLLHTAEHLTCTYCSTSEALGSNEKSRYLLQLEYELKDDKNVFLQKYLYQIPSIQNKPNTDIISITPEIKQKTEDFFSSLISASAINKYLKCPLDFYYRYIVQFDEETEVEELIENQHFGTFIHAVLEKLYRPFCQHDKNGIRISPSPPPVTIKDMDGMLIHFPKLLYKEFMTYFNEDANLFQKGRNKLSYEMAIIMTRNFLRAEKEFVASSKESLYIEFLEIGLQTSVQMEINQVQKTFQLKGFIDRVDRVGNTYRVLDYKSGKCKIEDVVFEKKENNTLSYSFSKASHALQLSFYSILFESKYGFTPQKSIIKSLLSPKKDFCLTNKKGDLADIKVHTLELIKEIYLELQQEEGEIAHNSESKYCAFCT